MKSNTILKIYFVNKNSKTEHLKNIQNIQTQKKESNTKNLQKQ